MDPGFPGGMVSPTCHSLTCCRFGGLAVLGVVYDFSESTFQPVVLLLLIFHLLCQDNLSFLNNKPDHIYNGYITE